MDQIYLVSCFGLSANLIHSTFPLIILKHTKFEEDKLFCQLLYINIARIAKLPYGQRTALLKERLYWKKGFIERKALLNTL